MQNLSNVMTLIIWLGNIQPPQTLQLELRPRLQGSHLHWHACTPRKVFDNCTLHHLWGAWKGHVLDMAMTQGTYTLRRIYGTHIAKNSRPIRPWKEKNFSITTICCKINIWLSFVTIHERCFDDCTLHLWGAWKGRVLEMAMTQGTYNLRKIYGTQISKSTRPRRHWKGIIFCCPLQPSVAK